MCSFECMILRVREYTVVSRATIIGRSFICSTEARGDMPSPRFSRKYEFYNQFICRICWLSRKQQITANQVIMNYFVNSVLIYLLINAIYKHDCHNFFSYALLKKLIYVRSSSYKQNKNYETE